jgi:hypothetical protein
MLCSMADAHDGCCDSSNSNIRGYPAQVQYGKQSRQ